MKSCDYVINVAPGTLGVFQRSLSLLLDSKRCTSKASLEVVLSTLKKFLLSTDHVLMLMTDGATSFVWFVLSKMPVVL